MHVLGGWLAATDTPADFLTAAETKRRWDLSVDRAFERVDRYNLISHKLFLKWFCQTQFPHKSVNVFFILVMVKYKLTDLRGS